MHDDKSMMKSHRCLIDRVGSIFDPAPGIVYCLSQLALNSIAPQRQVQKCDIHQPMPYLIKHPAEEAALDTSRLP
jgi:hypothetical protein